MLTRRDFLKQAGSAAAATAFVARTGQGWANTSTRPNILWIYSDDHAQNAVSAYGGRLAQVAPTPNIDRIANEGMIFRNS